MQRPRPTGCSRSQQRKKAPLLCHLGEERACGLFFKTNSVTDREVIEKIAEASKAGVKVTMLVRGISCLVPGVPKETENIRVVSIVGRLLEHSRIYAFGPLDSSEIYLSSADLMTRNMDKRVEIAWPVRNPDARRKILHYVHTCLADTDKLRELRSDGTFTPLHAFVTAGEAPFNAQETLIKEAHDASEAAHEEEMSEKTAFEKLSMQARDKRRKDVNERRAFTDLEEMYREALQHQIGGTDNDAMESFVNAAAKAFAEVEAKKLQAAALSGGEPVTDPAPAPAPAPTPAPLPQPRLRPSPSWRPNQRLRLRPNPSRHPRRLPNRHLRPSMRPHPSPCPPRPRKIPSPKSTASSGASSTRARMRATPRGSAAHEGNAEGHGTAPWPSFCGCPTPGFGSRERRLCPPGCGTGGSTKKAARRRPCATVCNAPLGKQTLGDLHGVERSALADLVHHEPHRDAVLYRGVVAQTAHIDVVGPASRPGMG